MLEGEQFDASLKVARRGTPRAAVHPITLNFAFLTLRFYSNRPTGSSSSSATALARAAGVAEDDEADAEACCAAAAAAAATDGAGNRNGMSR